MTDTVFGLELSEVAELKCLLDQDKMTLGQLLEAWKSTPQYCKAMLPILSERQRALWAEESRCRQVLAAG